MSPPTHRILLLLTSILALLILVLSQSGSGGGGRTNINDKEDDNEDGRLVVSSPISRSSSSTINNNLDNILSPSDDLNHDRPHHHGDDLLVADASPAAVGLLSASQEHLLSFARARSFEANGGRPTIIVTVATFSYREMLLNWLNALELLNFATNVSVVVLCASSNSSLHDFLLREKNIECYQTNWTVGGDYEGSRLQDPGRVWKKRIGFLALLVDAGLDVVMSDLDAIWLRDPFQPISKSDKPLFSPDRADVIAGRGEFPFFISKVLGATVCMGTAFFASNPRTSYLIHRAVSFTHQSEDDQYGINAALFSLMENKYVLPFKTHSKITLAGKNDALAVFNIPRHDSQIRILYVSHLQIPRFCNQLSRDDWMKYVVLAHCHLHDGAPSFVSLRGSAQAHHAVLKKYNLLHNNGSIGEQDDDDGR